MKIVNRFGLTAFDVCKTNELRGVLSQAWHESGGNAPLVFSDQMWLTILVLMNGLFKICHDPSLIETFKAKRMKYEEVTEQSEEVQETSSKLKFITVWKAGQIDDNDSDLKKVGPENFKALMKLGQGSFGIVYLVVKLIIDEKTGKPKQTNKFYAMKILNKKQIIGQNLVKYAKTERDVLTVTKHPFAIGLKYSFQTPDKLFMLLDYAPGGNMTR